MVHVSIESFLLHSTYQTKTFQPGVMVRIDINLAELLLNRFEAAVICHTFQLVSKFKSLKKSSVK